MHEKSNFHWRKTTDINHRYAIFELLLDDKMILDVNYSDAGIFEVTFDTQVAGLTIDWILFQNLMEDGRKMADLDK